MSESRNTRFTRILNILYPNGYDQIRAPRGNAVPFVKALRNGFFYNQEIYRTQQMAGQGNEGINYSKLRSFVFQLTNNLRTLNLNIVTTLPEGARVNNLLVLALNNDYDNKELVNLLNQIPVNDSTLYYYVRRGESYYQVPAYFFTTQGNRIVLRDQGTIDAIVTLQLVQLLGYVDIGVREVNTDIIDPSRLIFPDPPIDSVNLLIDQLGYATAAAYGGGTKSAKDAVVKKTKKIEDSPNPPPMEQELFNEMLDELTQEVTQEYLYGVTANELLNQVLAEGVDYLTLEIMIEELIQEINVLRTAEPVQPRLTITNPELNLQFTIVNEDIYIGNDDDDDMMRGPQDSLSQAVRNYIAANNPRDINNSYNRLANIIRDRMGDYRIGDVEYQFLINAVDTILSIPRGWNNVININNYIDMLRDPRPQLFQIESVLQSIISQLTVIPAVVDNLLLSALLQAFIIKISYYAGLINSPIEQPVQVNIMDIAIDVSQNYIISEDTVNVNDIRRDRIVSTPVTNISIIDIITNKQNVTKNATEVVESGSNNRPPPLERVVIPNTVRFNSQTWSDIEKAYDSSVNLQIGPGPSTQEVPSYTPSFVPDPGFDNMTDIVIDLAMTPVPNNYQLEVFAQKYKTSLESNKTVILDFINQTDWDYKGPPIDDDDEPGDFGPSFNITRKPDIDVPKLIDTVAGFGYIVKSITYWIASATYDTISYTANRSYMFTEKIINISMNCALSIVNSLGLKGKIAAIASTLYIGTIIGEEGVQGVTDRLSAAKNFIDTNVSNAGNIISTGSGIASDLSKVIKNVTESVLTFTASGLGAGVILILVGGLVYTLATGGLKFSVF